MEHILAEPSEIFGGNLRDRTNPGKYAEYIFEAICSVDHEGLVRQI